MFRDIKIIDLGEYPPPVLRTTGMEPYLIAVSCVSPQGSKIEGTRMKSAPAYIYKQTKQSDEDCKDHIAEAKYKYAPSENNNK